MTSFPADPTWNSTDSLVMTSLPALLSLPGARTARSPRTLVTSEELLQTGGPHLAPSEPRWWLFPSSNTLATGVLSGVTIDRVVTQKLQ